MKILPGPLKSSVPLTINQFMSMLCPTFLLLLSVVRSANVIEKVIVTPNRITPNTLTSNAITSNAITSHKITSHQKTSKKTTPNRLSSRSLKALRKRSNVKLSVQSPSIYKQHANTAELIILPTMKTIPTKEGVHCDEAGQCFELLPGDMGETVEYEVDYQETKASPYINDDIETARSKRLIDIETPEAATFHKKSSTKSVAKKRNIEIGNNYHSKSSKRRSGKIPANSDKNSGRSRRKPTMVLNEASCHCPEWLGCTTLSPLKSLRRKNGDICHCKPFTNRVECYKTCPIVHKNCIDTFSPELLDLEVDSNLVKAKNARIEMSNKNETHSPCVECKAIGCIDSKTGQKFLSGTRYQQNKCKQCRCGRNGGKLRCKKTCKKNDKPDEGHDFKRGVMMSDMQVMPIDRLAEKNSEIILIDDEAASKYSRTISGCCREGANWGQRYQSCKTVRVSNNKDKVYEQSCKIASTECCKKEVSDLQCKKGQTSARYFQPCNLYETTADKAKEQSCSTVIEKTCCNCCWIGLRMYDSALRNPQLCAQHANTMFGGHCKDSFMTCCKNGAQSGMGKSWKHVEDIQAIATAAHLKRIKCKEGYQRDVDSGICKDIDECEAGNNRCPTRTKCVNRPGSFRCVPLECASGYEGDAAGNCRDIDECAKGTDKCPKSATCVNSDGSYTCKCNTGFRYLSHRNQCRDINECARNLDDCKMTQKCVNLLGSFKCVDATKRCRKGFKPDKYNRRCNDIDECADSNLNNCQEDERCINIEGDFTCERQISCQIGTSLNSLSNVCEDIDECRRRTSGCEIGQRCINTFGSYSCVTDSCPTGFMHRNQDAQDYTCVDIDECSGIVNPCGEVGVCRNFQGSYTCHCKVGYEFDQTDGTCVDIDECSRGLDSCNYKCQNIIGGFECSCPPGFLIDKQYKNKCKDIDECDAKHTPKVCTADNDSCFNTFGSHQCLNLQCPDGFNMDTLRQKCMREQCKTSSCRTKPLRIKKIVQRFTAPINNRTTVLTQNLNIPIRVVSSVKIFTTNVLKKTAEQLFDATLHEVVPKNAVSSKKTSTNKSGSFKKSSTRIDVKLVKPLNVVSGVYHNKIYVTLKTKRRTERLLTELYLILESPGGDIMDLELEDNR